MRGMQPVPPGIASRFAEQFASDKCGFSADQIIAFFRRYSALVPPLEATMRPTRPALFARSLYVLEPRFQYQALTDLTKFVFPSKYAYPAESIRAVLRAELHAFMSPVPLGISVSNLSVATVRESWFRAYSRLADNPPAATTAARTMIEAVCKTIIAERGGQPDTSGDIGKLYKQAAHVLSLPRKSQAEHQIYSGLAGVVTGVASVANAAGDRHGNVGGALSDDPVLAMGCVHAAGVLCMSLVERHLALPL